MLDRWDRSGLSAAAFAPSVGVSPWTLYAWRRRERELSSVSASSCTAIVPAFVELAVDDPAAPTSSQRSAAIEIALPRGLALHVRPGFDAETLRRVVDALIS